MSYCPVSLTRFLAFFYLLNRKHCMPWRKAWIQGTVGYAINAAKEGKAPGRCGIPAEIWKHTWRYETRLLDFLRREKFCSKAWFKQEDTTANFPCAQGTFYLTSSSPLRRGITWSFNRHSRVIGWISLWPLILTYTTRTCPSWYGKTTTDRLEHFDRQRTRHPQLLGCPSPPSISFGYYVLPETLLSSISRTALAGKESVSNGSWDQTPIYWGSRYTSD